MVLAGALTDQCVESAVRDACDLQYLVTLVTGAPRAMGLGCFGASDLQLLVTLVKGALRAVGLGFPGVDGPRCDLQYLVTLVTCAPRAVT